MEPLTEHQIRAAFVNTSRGEAQRLSVPRDLAEQPWDELDYLGWRDPRAPERAYLVVELAGRPRAIALRCSTAPTARAARPNMCAMCLTTPANGVSLMVAARAGKAGKQGNSVGTYICSDLSCSLYLRGRKDPGPGARLPETIPLAEKIQRTAANLAAFVGRVTG